MRTIIVALAILYSHSMFSQNPIVPPGVYMADPAAQVWNDGRIYLYCSVDESVDYYCSRKYHVLSTNDMKQWSIHKNSFSSEGEGDQVPYNNNLLFAPDCMFRNGKYYLYYCQPDRENAEGVAVSDSPYGPFKNGRPMDIGPYNQIDPGVFIDDDGQAYYLWGQFTLKMAKLKENMTSLEKGSIIDNVLTEEEHYFHEGAYLAKHEDTYYLVYADMSRGNMPTCIGYATSDKPMGPYTYRGVIIDNDHSDPQCWNNHGSIAEFNGQWYVFYHRPTHNSRKMRKACVEPIEFLEDGSIPEVEMTSQGTGGPLDAFLEIDAASACWMFGNVRIEAISPGNEALMKAHNRDRAVVKYVDFGTGASRAEIDVLPGNTGGSIHLKAGFPWSESIATFNVEPGSDDQQWVTLDSSILKTKGVHALWIVYYGDQNSAESGMGLDAIRFYK